MSEGKGNKSKKQQVIEIGTVIAIVATILAIFQFYRGEVNGSYDKLDQGYVEFQKLCMENIQLDCYDVHSTSLPNLEGKEIVRQKLLYSILISLMERAYLQFNDDLIGQWIGGRQKQWHGWDLYISNFAERPAFQSVWNEIGKEFDSEFQNYMHQMIKKNAK